MGATTAFVVTAIAGGHRARAQHKAGKEAERIANFNARIAELQADEALKQGEREAADFSIKVRRMIGTQTAGYAGQGVDVGEGSAVRVVADTAKYGELDRLRIINNARLEAWGLRTQGISLRAQGRLDRKRGDYEAFSTILGTGASLTRLAPDMRAAWEARRARRRGSG